MEVNRKVYTLIPKGNRKKYQYSQLQKEERTPGQPQSRNECYFIAKGQELSNTDGPQLPRKLPRQEKPWIDSENLSNKITLFSSANDIFSSFQKKKKKNHTNPPHRNKQTKNNHKPTTKKSPVFNAASLVAPLIYQSTFYRTIFKVTE